MKSAGKASASTTTSDDVRAEFEEFFRAAYPWLASQLHAITGDSGTAGWAVDAAFEQCWQQWDTVRRLTDPQTWVRWTALRAAARGRTEPSFRRGPVATLPIPTDTDDGVVLAALQELPRAQRQAVVLHYMGDVPVEEIARRSGTTADAVDWLLDRGFDALVELLGWPADGTPADPSTDESPDGEPHGAVDPRLDWTAEALGDTAMRLAAEVTVPDPAALLQRVALRRWAKRAAPIAVSAACVSAIVVLAAQLGPAGTPPPRTPTIYVAAPAAGEGGGYARVQPPPVADGRPTSPGDASPLPYLGMRIVPVVQASVLADFGVSAPPAPDARPVTAGSSSGTSAAVRAGSSNAATTGSTVTAPAVGSRPTTSSGSSSGGVVPPTSTGSGTTSPATVPPAPTPRPTVPPDPATIPPTTAPPLTTPPSATPPAPTDPPVVVTTDPPVVTTDAPVVTTTTPLPTAPVTTAAETAEGDPTTAEGV